MVPKYILVFIILATLSSSHADFWTFVKNPFKAPANLEPAKELELNLRQITTVAATTVRKCPIGASCPSDPVLCNVTAITCDNTSFCCVDRNTSVTCCLGAVRPTDPITVAVTTTPIPTQAATPASPPAPTSAPTPVPTAAPTPASAAPTTHSTVKCG